MPIPQPNAPCDPIIYEATVKACEIIVDRRCCPLSTDDVVTTGRVIRQHSDLSRNYGASLSQQQQLQQQGCNSRFNLQTTEVPQIRQVLSGWRSDLTMPLRLDVYYEHYPGDNGDNYSSGMPTTNTLSTNNEPQRELLERWCLDYLPQNNAIVPLRSVCQRIVVRLRSLYCLLNLLPANTFDSTHGKIGYSIYTIDKDSEENHHLPSPSFAFKSLPSITTGMGVMNLSVMYDATLRQDYPVPVSGQKIIRDYHSQMPVREEGEKRVMSGLSLVMMGEEENLMSQPQNEPPMPQLQSLQLEPSHVVQDVEERLLPWGSPATRAAFHLPPVYGEAQDCNFDGKEPHQTVMDPSGENNLSISPSPFISTPPQSMWGKPRPDDSSVARMNEGDDSAPPFVNPTTLQPSPSRSISQSTSHYTDAPSRSSDKSGLEPSQQRSTKRNSSSSVLLPPVTSLDLLQKSPFSAKSTVVERDTDGIAMPFILESYRDDVLTSSVPRMISAVPRSSGIGFGTLSNSGPYSKSFHGGLSQSHSNIDAEEMPFAVDDDFPLIGSASNPFGVKSGKLSSASGKSETVDSSMSNIMSSSLAVSSLHQRCVAEGKPRLKLFESSTQSIKLKNDMEEDGGALNDYATIKEQLSELRNFGASLMVGSSHDSCSE